MLKKIYTEESEQRLLVCLKRGDSKSAFQVRQESDYDDFCIISKEDVDEQIENARKLIDAVKSYVCKIQ